MTRRKKTTCFNYQGPKSKGTNVRRKTACIIFKIVKKNMFHFQDSEKNSIFLSQDSEKYSLNHFQDSQKKTHAWFSRWPKNKCDASKITRNDQHLNIAFDNCIFKIDNWRMENKNRRFAVYIFEK